jgi:hypothetical protein
MYFSTKSYLKSNRNHTAKHTLRLVKQLDFFNVFFKSFGAVILFFYVIHDFVSKFKT